MRTLALLSLFAVVGCSSSPSLEGTWTRAEWDMGTGWQEGPESRLNFSAAGTLRNWGTTPGGETFDNLQKFFVKDGIMYRCAENVATCTADNSVYAARVEFSGDNEMVLYDGITVDKELAIKHRYKRGE